MISIIEKQRDDLTKQFYEEFMELTLYGEDENGNMIEEVNENSKPFPKYVEVYRYKKNVNKDKVSDICNLIDNMDFILDKYKFENNMVLVK